MLIGSAVGTQKQSGWRVDDGAGARSAWLNVRFCLDARTIRNFTRKRLVWQPLAQHETTTRDQFWVFFSFAKSAHRTPMPFIYLFNSASALLFASARALANFISRKFVIFQYLHDLHVSHFGPLKSIQNSIHFDARAQASLSNLLIPFFVAVR